MLLEEGFDVTSVDASDKMLKYALKTRWNRRKEQAFDNWGKVNDKYHHVIPSLDNYYQKRNCKIIIWKILSLEINSDVVMRICSTAGNVRNLIWKRSSTHPFGRQSLRNFGTFLQNHPVLMPCNFVGNVVKFNRT